MNIVSKKCSRCAEVLPVSEFHRRPELNRYRSQCKVCERETRVRKYKPYVPLWVPNPLNAELNNFKAAAEPANNGLFRRFA